MKNLVFFTIIFAFKACSTSRNLYDQTFEKALIGQNEKVIYSRMGQPSQVEKTSDGGKVLVYEFDSRGMFLSPNKSNITYGTSTDPQGNRLGWTFNSNVNKAANDPKYTIYQTKVSYFRVFLDQEGKCTHYQQNMPVEQLDIYHERFKHISSGK